MLTINGNSTSIDLLQATSSEMDLQEQISHHTDAEEFFRTEANNPNRMGFDKIIFKDAIPNIDNLKVGSILSCTTSGRAPGSPEDMWRALPVKW